jgi:hypothetical protein
MDNPNRNIFGGFCYISPLSSVANFEFAFVLSNDFIIDLFLVEILIASNGKGKGKAVPLQAWSGPEGSNKLRFPDFVTTAQDGAKFVSLTHRPHLPPGNAPGTHFC